MSKSSSAPTSATNRSQSYIDPVDYKKRDAWARAYGVRPVREYPCLRALTGQKCAGHAFCRQNWGLVLDHGLSWRRGNKSILTFTPYTCSAYPQELDRLRAFCVQHGLRLTVSSDSWYVAPPPADLTLLLVIECAESNSEAGHDN
jgi:hypothetical protein